MEECKGKETPRTKEGMEKSAKGEPLVAGRAKSARREIVIRNGLAQGRPDIVVTA